MDSSEPGALASSKHLTRDWVRKKARQMRRLSKGELVALPEQNGSREFDRPRVMVCPDARIKSPAIKFDRLDLWFCLEPLEFERTRSASNRQGSPSSAN